MSFDRIALLSLAAVIGLSTSAPADDPQIRSLQQLGLQNITSISSHARMGGPQGISLHELPAAMAYCDAQRVDSFYAVRAGSKAAVPQFDLAHPSHVPGAPGSRPFVSDGPLSHSPGTRRLRNTTPYTPQSYPYLSATESARPGTQQPNVMPHNVSPQNVTNQSFASSSVTTATSPAQSALTALAEDDQHAASPIVTTTTAAARFLSSLGQ